MCGVDVRGVRCRTRELGKSCHVRARHRVPGPHLRCMANSRPKFVIEQDTQLPGEC